MPARTTTPTRPPTTERRFDRDSTREVSGGGCRIHHAMTMPPATRAAAGASHSVSVLPERGGSRSTAPVYEDRSSAMMVSSSIPASTLSSTRLIMSRAICEGELAIDSPWQTGHLIRFPISATRSLDVGELTTTASTARAMTRMALAKRALLVRSDISRGMRLLESPGLSLDCSQHPSGSRCGSAHPEEPDHW